ncbi:hypothetical protein C1H46_002974 [Malus baccata]|uniref:Uncharacterized protein n=1 Tax=Malus baccata TaxID=106549 RepID=A0A540NK70_MALBA|nr:hypothetical protein C1H46_002974 [Malus baccata]
MLSCVGADRLQTGMRGAFRKPLRTCARVDIGQVLLSVRCKESNKSHAMPSSSFPAAKGSLRAGNEDSLSSAELTM